MTKIIAFVGFKGSGKDTAGMFCKQYGFQTIAFADSIKDCLSSMFLWDREMLSGRTIESREWREQVDHWWAEKLNIPNFTPRLAMTTFGTDIMRNYFNPMIWILNTERKMSIMKSDICITDCRHPEELELVSRLGGKIYRIKRGDDPFWYDMALKANTGDTKAVDFMKELGIHESEWGWIGHDVTETIDNSGSLTNLHSQIASIIGEPT